MKETIEKIVSDRIQEGQLDEAPLTLEEITRQLHQLRPMEILLTNADRIERVVEVVKKWIKPETWPVVIVGPVGDARGELEKLGYGPVEMASSR